MKIFLFLFFLSVSTIVFEFLWTVLKFLFNFLTAPVQSPLKSKGLRIAKYAIYSLVILEYSSIIESTYHIQPHFASVLTLLFMTLYLFSRFQNRSSYAQMKVMANQFVKGFDNAFDVKFEKYLIFGALITVGIGKFLLGNFEMAISHWFTIAIINLYTTPIFGFIFKVVGMFSLFNAISTGSKIIGQLISGQSFDKATTSERNIFDSFKGQNLNKSLFNNNEQKEEPEFTEYEDVTDEFTDDK